MSGDVFTQSLRGTTSGPPGLFREVEDGAEDGKATDAGDTEVVTDDSSCEGMRCGVHGCEGMRCGVRHSDALPRFMAEDDETT